jgi:hypothetical protein
MSLAICVFSTMLNLNCLILECIAILVEFCKTLPAVALIEYIEHEYAWLKKLASNVTGEEQESICY